MQQGLEAVGAPNFTDEDRALAAQFQKGFDPAEIEAQIKWYGEKYGEETAREIAKSPLMDKVILPLQFNPIVSPGSTDVGDVSYVCPTAQLFTCTFAIGTAGHSWQLTAMSGCNIGHEGMLTAGKAMACAAVKAMQNPDVLQKAREEYVKTTGGSYICPVPADVAPMLDGVK